MRAGFYIALFAIEIPIWLFAIYCVFRFASYGLAINDHRTAQANWIVRRFPLWFMIDGMLTPEGLPLREPYILWLKRFVVSLAAFMLIIGLAMLIAWKSPFLNTPL